MGLAAPVLFGQAQDLASAPGFAGREKLRLRAREGPADGEARHRRVRKANLQSRHGEPPPRAFPTLFQTGSSASTEASVTNILKKINIRTIVPCQEPTSARRA